MSKSKKEQTLFEVVDKAVEALKSLNDICNSCIAELEKIKTENQPTNKEKVEESKDIKQPSLEELRALLAELSRRGYTSNVKFMLIGCGVNKLSEVDPKDYADLYAKAKELDDATKE